jgi:HK97 family phage major capsid protein
MTTTEKEALLAKRKGLIEDARAAVDLSMESHGHITAEAEAESKKLLDAADAIRVQIKAADEQAARQAQFAARLQEAEADLRAGVGRSTRPADVGGAKPSPTKFMFGNFEVDAAASPEWANRASDQYRNRFADFIVGRPGATIGLEVATEGGIFAPPQFVGQLIKELDEDFVFRSLAKKIPPTKARELEYPRRTTRERRLTKGQTWSSGGTAAALGSMKLQLHPWTGEVSINKALLQFSPFNVEGFVRDEIRYDYAATQEQLFMTGTGNLEPFGIFTAHAAGLPTSADVTTTISWAGILQWKMALRDAYLKSKSLRILCHRNFQWQLTQIRSTDGIPLFQPSLVVGTPDTCLGVPMMYSEFAPDGSETDATPYASGDYAAVIGDFSNYWIFDGMDLPIEQHNLETRNNLQSYLYRVWFDGGVAMPEAFKRLKIT